MLSIRPLTALFITRRGILSQRKECPPTKVSLICSRFFTAAHRSDFVVPSRSAVRSDTNDRRVHVQTSFQQNQHSVRHESLPDGFRALSFLGWIERPAPPCVTARESVRPHSCSTNRFRRKHRVSFAGRSFQGRFFTSAKHTRPHSVTPQTAAPFDQLIQLWWRFRNRLRRDSSRKHETRGKLRREREIDNFTCSHRCTSTVRLWLGARSVCQHRRVPLYHLVVFILFFLISFLLPCPSPKCLSLYSFTLANPSLFQYRSRAPAVSSAIGFGISPLLIHLRIVPR